MVVAVAMVGYGYGLDYGSTPRPPFTFRRRGTPLGDSREVSAIYPFSMATLAWCCYRWVTCGITFRLAGAHPWAIPGTCLLLDLFFKFVEHQ